MELSIRDGLNARNLFNKHFMVLLGMLAKPFEFNKQNHLNEIIEILLKLLLVIERTHIKAQDQLFDDRALTGILNFVNVRKISRDFNFKDIINKYETTLNSIKNLANLFYSKELTFHKALSILTQYSNGYNNILSRSALIFNFNTLAGKTEDEIKRFFAPYLHNEVKLYIQPQRQSTITPTVIQKALDSSYNVFYDALVKFGFDKEKQFIYLQKVLSEITCLLKTLVS